MKPSANTTEQEGEPSWVIGSWNQPSGVAGLDTGRPYAENRLEWEWDNTMMMRQHAACGNGPDENGEIRKSPISGTLASGFRSYTSILSSGFPSNFSQNSMGIFSSTAIRSFEGLQDLASISSSSGLEAAVSSSSIPGITCLAAGAGDMHSTFEQRRRQYFGLITDQRGPTNDSSVKREADICGTDGHATRIGLNLGVRTYFSSEDTAAGRFGKRHRANSPGSQAPMCQAEGCRADLSAAKHYHRRHKVCELHSKSANVVAAGQTQRFCQQCSRFHVLSEFDEGKRSCRKRLADHNRRRRKPQQSASNSVGGALLECTSPKTNEAFNHTCASPRPSSMSIRLRQSGSPSSVSVEDSDDKMGSVRTNVRLGASSGFEGHVMVLNPQVTSFSGSCPYSQSLSSMSVIPTVPVVFQSITRPPSILPESSEAVNDQIFQGLGRQRGTHLSLSSLGKMSHRSPCEQDTIEPSVPWLRSTRQGHDVFQRDRGMNPVLQHPRPEKFSPGKTSTSTTTQVYSESIQNMPPSMSGSDWIVGPRDNNAPQVNSSGLDIPGEDLESHQFALLENASETRQCALEVGQGRVVEFLQQRGSQGVEDGTRADGSDMKFSDLQMLRPGSFEPSLYDSP